MSFIRGENEVSYVYTSGTGVFNIAGRGASLRWVIWEHNGNASGVVVSILDTISGTAASGLWLVASGVEHISNASPTFTSGMDGAGGAAVPRRIDYGITVVDSGLAVVISGGAANAVRAFVGYIAREV